jgi:2-dehydro-3-deoxygluconokinase
MSKGVDMKNRVVTLGEIMLRLKPNNFERFLQSPLFEATFGGSEANVAISLAIFGLDVAFVTALPANPIADACIRFLRGYGVGTSHIVRQGERLGIYFLEAGANQRPSNVVYDRAYSSISTAQASDFDWDAIFSGAAWFHITGITPALSQSAADLSLAAVQAAQARGVTVSCDFNYRQKLWNYGKTASQVMNELLPYVDLLLATEADCHHLLGMPPPDSAREPAENSAGLDPARYRALSAKLFTSFPNLRVHALTRRQSYSASHNGWSAYLFNGSQMFASRRYDITAIVDRVGGGDAFAAGLIYGLHTGLAEVDALEYAVAASCLKHAIAGDVNLATAAEVERLLVEDSSGLVRR